MIFRQLKLLTVQKEAGGEITTMGGLFLLDDIAYEEDNKLCDHLL
jgi:hypothetical protein